MTTDFINGIEVPELTQEQMNILVETREMGGHSPMQTGDSFAMGKFMAAVAAYMNKHRSREIPSGPTQ